MEYRISKYKPITYKATKRNRSFMGYNMISSTELSIDEFGKDVVILHITKKVENQEALVELSDYLNALLSCNVEFNKNEQLRTIIKQHYKDIGMSESLSESLTKAICDDKTIVESS